MSAKQTLSALVLVIVWAVCRISDGCIEPLGMKDKTIPDGYITASSAHIRSEVYYNGSEGRLDGGAFWMPSPSAGSWVQVDFGYPNTKLINGIITQGTGPKFQRWVEELQVQYGNSTDALTSILSPGTSNPMTFKANIDDTHHHTIIFPDTIHASIIRILPIKYERTVALRWEILGCDPDFVPASQGACTVSSPCQNNGECVDFSHPTAHACVCPEAFIGDNCERIAYSTACTYEPCINNGTCQDWDDKYVYFCHCQDDYEGKNCQTYDAPLSDHPCKSNPCKNGGECHGPRDDIYCTCPFPYDRDWCTKWAVKYIIMVVILVLLGCKVLFWCCYCCCKALASDEEEAGGNDVKLEEAKSTQEPMLEEKA